MLFERQKHLLALVEALGGEIDNLDFQKLLFLYCCEIQPKPSYEFVPYQFGGFSFTSYADKRRLTAHGMLANEERVWKLTPLGRVSASLASADRLCISQFARHHVGLRGDALIAEAYRRYPYYAIRSEIAERVLAGDSPALRAIAAERPAVSQPGLCTIGYEGHSLESYLNRLIRDSATLLCDVRRNPLSRKYGFSKGVLSKACANVGIRYEHRPKLGIASADRQKLETQVDYDVLFAVYKRDCLPKQTDVLREIGLWVETGQRVALTCYERLSQQCHRQCVAEALEQMFGAACAPRHL